MTIMRLDIFILAVIIVSSGCCGSSDTSMDIRKDHAAIKELMDKSILSADPIASFQVNLPTVRSFTSVDSVWVSGRVFYVQYKKGGLVSWTAP